MRTVCLFILAGMLTFGLPFVSTAQTELEVLKQIAAAAESDAAEDAGAGECLWFCTGFSLALGGGCLLGALSLVGSYLYRPAPPLTRLVGKPPEYIAVYVDTYKDERRVSASSAAIIGCTFLWEQKPLPDVWLLRVFLRGQRHFRNQLMNMDTV